ncbi:DUF1203 domain-containing protein [Streptomyces sp. NPDC021608]|uniref:DUF1203 domain-containing protein n=1 Tax=Streptomyces sp. NPDC021608 TaxID=3154903 RepID=UPI00340A61D4
MTDEEGGAPLRCALAPQRARRVRRPRLLRAPAAPGGRGAGVDPGPYDEPGPVFLHARACPGPAGDALPFTDGHRALRRSSHDGRILGGRLVGDPDGFGAAFAEAFADPRVALVHVRAVEYGCFLYEVRSR